MSQPAGCVGKQKELEKYPKPDLRMLLKAELRRDERMQRIPASRAGGHSVPSLLRHAHVRWELDHIACNNAEAGVAGTLNVRN